MTWDYEHYIVLRKAEKTYSILYSKASYIFKVYVRVYKYICINKRLKKTCRIYTKTLSFDS